MSSEFFLRVDYVARQDIINNKHACTNNTVCFIMAARIALRYFGVPHWVLLGHARRASRSKPEADDMNTPG